MIRLLIVDDHTVVRQGLSMLFGTVDDIEVVGTAADGILALNQVHELTPDVVLMDIGMPRMDGYEAARRIRRALGNRVMLVALTGWGQEEDKSRAREAGFDHHLTKPAEPEMLERLIGDCACRRAGIS